MGLQEVRLVDVIPLRHDVLRPGQAVETCYFEGDDAETTRHYAWVEDGRVVSIATVMEVGRDFDGQTVPYQLRGMATDPAFAGRGIGSSFLQALHEAVSDSWWCNARAIAVRFYERNGLVTVGDAFDIPGIGPHYVMKYEKTAGS